MINAVITALVILGAIGWLFHLAAPDELEHQQEIGDELQPPDQPGPDRTG